MLKKSLSSILALAVMSLPAQADEVTKARAEALIARYIAAMKTCDVDTFDDLHADNMKGQGFAEGSAPFGHIQLASLCKTSAPEDVKFKLVSAGEEYGILSASAEASASLAGRDGKASATRFTLKVDSRLTANGDEQIISSWILYLDEADT